MSQDERLAPRNSAFIDTFAPVEGYDKNDVRGKEGITAADWKPAFLCIAQLTSAVKDETGDSYIEGIKLGDIYNSETKELYGRGPVEFQLLRHRKRAYLPDENGRMGEEIPWDDPRCDWPSDEEKKSWADDGKKGKPRPEGVRVYDWVVLLMTGELAVISFKSKSFGAGQTLTKWAGMVQGPVFIAKFAVKSLLKENEAGKFGVFTVETAGKPTAEQIANAERIQKQIEGKEIPTDEQAAQDGGSDAPEGTAAPAVEEQPSGRGGRTKREKVPF